MNTRFDVERALAVAIVLLFAAAPVSADRDDAQTPTSDSMRGTKPGHLREDNDLKMPFVWCPPGAFKMEHPDGVEEVIVKGEDGEPKTKLVAKMVPVKVFLTRGYWLGKYEVTQAEWKQLMNTTPWSGGQWIIEDDSAPATYIGWEDATEFCETLTERERKAGRLPGDWAYTLPTDAQWERACRARTDSAFSFGDDESQLGEHAWFLDNAMKAGERYAHKVGQKKPNLWGLHDMHGNALEWCRDFHTFKLPGGRDPQVTDSTPTAGLGIRRVIRGGSFSNNPVGCRSAHRSGYPPEHHDGATGFRVALVNKPE